MAEQGILHVKNTDEYLVTGDKLVAPNSQDVARADVKTPSGHTKTGFNAGLIQEFAANFSTATNASSCSIAQHGYTMTVEAYGPHANSRARSETEKRVAENNGIHFADTKNIQCKDFKQGKPAIIQANKSL